VPTILGLWGGSLDHLVHLVVAFLLAPPIGWNRARVDRSAGLRTFPLVAMAGCGLVQTAISVLGPSVPNQASILGAAVGYSYYDIGIILAVANLMVLLIPTACRAGSSAPDSSLQDR
jgi:putative Mg2+ transporter-C (MgtC) family protein